MFLIILFLSDFTLKSEQPPGQSLVLISLITLTSDDDRDESAEKLLDDIITYKLQDQGFSVIPEEDPLSSYKVSIAYSLKENSLYINLLCTRSADGAEIFNEISNVKIDLNIDRELDPATDRLIETINQDMAAFPETVTYLPEKEPEPVTPEVVETAPETDSAEEQQPDTSVWKPVSLGVLVSPFLTAGNASRYFVFAIVPEFHGQYKIRTGFGYVGLGGFLSMTYFQAEGLVAISDNFLISAGPEVRLSFFFGQRLEAFILVNGGVSLFILTSEGGDSLTALIPCISGGAGVNFNFSDRFGLSVTTSYTAHFEQSVTFSGFTPGVGIYWRL